MKGRLRSTRTSPSIERQGLRCGASFFAVFLSPQRRRCSRGCAFEQHSNLVSVNHAPLRRVLKKVRQSAAHRANAVSNTYVDLQPVVGHNHKSKEISFTPVSRVIS